MPKQSFSIASVEEYAKAGPKDLIEMQPVPGSNPLFLNKETIELVVYSITHHEFLHLSGPTGSAKTSLLEALYLVPENFRSVCLALGMEDKPLRMFPVEMVTYETPGELRTRRALKDGATFDENSELVGALCQAAGSNGCYNAIWLREFGRVHSSAVQGGLLDLMTKSDIFLPGGRRIDGRAIAWLADSNYQAEGESTHTLVTLDDALKRRFSINWTLGYLEPAQEVHVLEHEIRRRGLKRIEQPLILNVVNLGQKVRQRRTEGTLLSVPPPTIYGYLAFLLMCEGLPHHSLKTIAFATLLGNASSEDSKVGTAVFNEVFGLQSGSEEDPTQGGGIL